MADGMSSATVRRQWKNWGLRLHEVGRPKHWRLTVYRTFYERSRLAREAKKRGRSEEYLRRISVFATISTAQSQMVSSNDGRLDTDAR